MDLSFQTILLDKTIVLFMYLEIPNMERQVIAVRLGSYSHSDSSVFLFVFILAKSVFSTIAELIWSPTETQDQWHNWGTEGYVQSPTPCRKTLQLGCARKTVQPLIQFVIQGSWRSRGIFSFTSAGFGTEPGAHIMPSKGLLIRWFTSLFFPRRLK